MRQCVAYLGCPEHILMTVHCRFIQNLEAVTVNKTCCSSDKFRTFHQNTGGSIHLQIKLNQGHVTSRNLGYISQNMLFRGSSMKFSQSKNLWLDLCQDAFIYRCIKIYFCAFSKHFSTSLCLPVCNAWNNFVFVIGIIDSVHTKNFLKNISYLLIHTCMCARLRGRNFSFQQNFLNVLNLIFGGMSSKK